MSLKDLPPIREALEEYGLLAKKSFGQHFLLDLNITRKIARLAEVVEGQTVIEVGPGPGGLLSVPGCGLAGTSRPKNSKKSTTFF